MHEPVKVEHRNAVSYYRLNIGTVKKLIEKERLDVFAREEEKHPLGSPINTIRSIEAIAEPPIDLSEVSGEDLLNICDDFAEEFNRFFPRPETVEMVKAGMHRKPAESPTISPTTPSEPCTDGSSGQ